MKKAIIITALALALIGCSAEPSQNTGCEALITNRQITFDGTTYTVTTTYLNELTNVTTQHVATYTQDQYNTIRFRSIGTCDSD